MFFNLFYTKCDQTHLFIFKVKENGKMKYLIQLCGGINSDSTSSCNSHMVCREDGVSFGEPKNYKVTKEGRYLKMTYDNIGKCPGRFKILTMVSTCVI